eukprot:768631-Hanusia_phi.AAC.6
MVFMRLSLKTFHPRQTHKGGGISQLILFSFILLLLPISSPCSYTTTSAQVQQSSGTRANPKKLTCYPSCKDWPGCCIDSLLYDLEDVHDLSSGLQERASLWLDDTPPANYADLETDFDQVNARLQGKVMKIVRMSRGVLRYLDNPNDSATLQPLQVFWKQLNRRATVLDELYKARRRGAMMVWDNRDVAYFYNDDHLNAITKFTTEMDELQAQILQQVDELDKLLESGKLSSIREHVLEAFVGVGATNDTISSPCICRRLAVEQQNEADSQRVGRMPEDLPLRGQVKAERRERSKGEEREGPATLSEEEKWSDLDLNLFDEEEVDTQYRSTFEKAKHDYFEAPQKEEKNDVILKFALGKR